MQNARLIGAGQYVPEKIVTSDELEQRMRFEELGARRGTIRLLNGVKTRHFAADDENASDLAYKAAQGAVEMAGIDVESIDLLIFASISQDFSEPATANRVQYLLGAINAKCFDVKNACNAFLTAVEIANCYIRCGEVKTVLIASGEVMHKYIKWDYESKEELTGTNATLGFGDGGGAVILQAADEEGYGIRTRFETNGIYWNEGAIWGGGTMHMADPDLFTMKNIDSEMVKKNTVRAAKFYFDCLREDGVNKDEVSRFVTTQMGKYKILQLADALKLPHEKMVLQCEELGNTAAASMPIGITRSLEDGLIELGKHQQIVLFGAANGLTLGYAHMTI